uniref:Pentacotripeptide-repeat region of PRORP domain-containing protein n=1 Tax=Hyaloperonospora arabidopsidis (strain Emoy2) TaxID=559515 RepID=M4B279_HYAAE
MLSRHRRVSWQLLKLSWHAASTCHTSAAIHSTYSATRRTSHRPSASSRRLNISVSPVQQDSQSFSRSLQQRSFTRDNGKPGPPIPVPQDEYEELKTFLAEPETSGPIVDRAKEIVMKWMQQYVTSDMPGQDATVMVMVADAMQDPQFVMHVYTYLRDAGVSPSPITLEYSVAACAQLGQWQTAMEIVDYMHQAVEIMKPSLDIYENAITSCHAAKKWIKAKYLLEEMRTYKLEASPKLHVASIRLCIESLESTATEVLLRAFLRAYEGTLDADEIRDIITDLFHAAVDAESLPQALFLRNELMTRQYSVSKELYSRLVYLCAMKRQWHKGRTNDIDVPLVVYNAALRNFGQISLAGDALSVYSNMRKHQVVADAASFAALMCSCGTKVKQSEDFFRELQRANCKPTLDVVHAYLLVPSRAKEWEEVLRRYALVHDEQPLYTGLPLESDVRVQSLVAVAYGRVHHSEEMLRIFTNMKVKGMEPNLHVYGEALFAYIRQDQWRHALMLFDHLFQQQTSEMQEKRKLETFPMLWDAAVLACEKGEQIERAAMLYDTIIEQRVSISMTTGERLAAMLTSIPSETLWRSFQLIPSLYKTKTKSHLNPRVQNAVLRRAVEENDSNLAERIVTDGMQKMEITPNSMTFALMLRLYANREDQESFHLWLGRMDESKVKPTLFVFRALMHQLSNLSHDCENRMYVDAIGDFLHEYQSVPSAINSANIKNTREYVANLGRTALDIMEARGIGPDTICLQNYLLLSQDPDHVIRALVLVEDAVSATSERGEDTAQGCVHLTSRLLHTLFTALDNYPDGQRMRKLLVQIVKDLPTDLSEDAIAAFCAANDGQNALQLLQELLDSKCSLSDEHVLFFLTNSYTCELSSPASGDSRPKSANGMIVDMVSLLCASETVAMEAGCLAFLIQHIVDLSKWQQQDGFDVSTQEEIDAMKKLLVRAFAHFSISQVTEFLSKVIARDDLVHVISVLDELQGA